MIWRESWRLIDGGIRKEEEEEVEVEVEVGEVEIQENKV
jgi:hypothetical protein